MNLTQAIDLLQAGETDKLLEGTKYDTNLAKASLETIVSLMSCENDKALNAARCQVLLLAVMELKEALNDQLHCHPKFLTIAHAEQAEQALADATRLLEVLS